MKIVWRWKASSKFSCIRLTRFPCHFLCWGIGGGSPSGAILCSTEPGATKLGGEGSSISRADIQGRSKECQSLCQHAQGRTFFSTSWHRQAGAWPSCVQGWLRVSPSWWRQPYLPCAAHAGTMAQRPVWHVLQVSAGQDPCPWDLALLLSSGEASEVVGMWDPWRMPLLVLLAFAITSGQENRAALGLGIIPLMVVTNALLLHSCFSLTLLPFTARRNLQQINTRAAGGPSAKELKCTMKLSPLQRFIHIPEAEDWVGLNYTLPFTDS